MTSLKKARESVGLTQRELADAAGISVRTLESYEQGRRDINDASALTVFQLACALTVHSGGRQYTVEDLLEVGE